MMFPDVVIFAGGAIGSPISICRNIKRKYEVNAYVICINSFYLQPVFEKSRYITQVFSFDGISNSSQLLEVIRKWYAEMNFRQKPVVFSTTDISCIYVSDFRKEYEELFVLTFPSTTLIKTYTSKGMAEVNAGRYGLCVPQGKVVAKEMEINRVVESFQFPVILKPVSTREEDKLGFKVKVLSKEEFLSCSKELLESGHHFLCQEYIPGSDNSVWFYLFVRSRDGQVFDVMGIKTLQSPPGNGIMAIGEMQSNAELRDLCREFLAKLGYEGIGGLEFKYFEGKYYFIEMNVRTEAIVPISDALLPFSLVAYEDALGILDNDKYLIPDKYVKYIDFRALLSSRLKRKEYGRFVTDICSNCFRKSVRYNILYKDDWKPFVYTLIMSVRHGLEKVFCKK